MVIEEEFCGILTSSHALDTLDRFRGGTSMRYAGGNLDAALFLSSAGAISVMRLLLWGKKKSADAMRHIYIRNQNQKFPEPKVVMWG